MTNYQETFFFKDFGTNGDRIAEAIKAIRDAVTAIDETPCNDTVTNALNNLLWACDELEEVPAILDRMAGEIYGNK